jgi:hypothetical protein
MARGAIIRRRRDCFFRLENKSVQRLQHLPNFFLRRIFVAERNCRRTPFMVGLLGLIHE